MLVTGLGVPAEPQNACEKSVKAQGQMVSPAAAGSGFAKDPVRLELTVPFINTEKWQCAAVVQFDNLMRTSSYRQPEREVFVPLAKQRVADGSANGWLVSLGLLAAGRKSDANLS